MCAVLVWRLFKVVSNVSCVSGERKKKINEHASIVEGLKLCWPDIVCPPVRPVGRPFTSEQSEGRAEVRDVVDGCRQTLRNLSGALGTADCLICLGPVSRT